MSTLQVANLVFESTANNRIQYIGSNTITISTAGNENVRIDASGNVGIGATSLNARLQFASEVASTAGTSNKVLLYYGSSTAAFGLGIASGQMTYNCGDGAHVFYTGGNASPTERARIDANGAVTLSGSLTVQTGGGTITGGFIVAPGNLGTISSGTTTLSPTTGNYQYYTNNGAHTIAAPASDCAIDILVTNGASAGTITLSGFTAPSGGGGDTYATTNANRYMLMVRRINGISTYSWKALQ